jgi:putative lipoic acid-binding regulatory protein
MNILNPNQSPEDFYVSLKEKLESVHDFPENYLFKFIIPTEQQKLTEIYRVFDGMEYTLSNRDSKNGKYVSVSINAFVLDADQVIKIYKEVAKIENVLML